MRKNIHLERSKEILKIFDDEQIHTSFRFGKVLNLARDKTRVMADNEGMPGPGMTACVATTLLNVGLCQELSQRFLLEYILQI